MGYADSRVSICVLCTVYCSLGINEDAVTGSAHCALCPYWLERSQRLGLTKETLLAKQQSPRGGILRVRLSGDRVLLQGTAVTTIKGKILG